MRNEEHVDSQLSWNQDTTYMHCCAIAAGTKWLVAPNGTLLAQSGDGREFCIAQGVVPGVSQATAALLSEQDIVRTVLHREGIPTPETQVHHLTEGPGTILRAAEAWGFPLTIRPASISPAAPAPHRAVLVENANMAEEVLRSIYDRAGLRARRPALPQGRLMLERPSGTTELVALVVGGRIIASATAAATAEGARRSYCTSEVNSLSFDLTQTIRRTVNAIPDLPAATVHLLIDEASRERPHGHVVIALEIYPRFALHERAKAGAGIQLAAVLFGQVLGGQLQMRELTRTSTYRIDITGINDGADTFSALDDALAESGLDGTVDRASIRGMTVSAEVAGKPAALASFTKALFDQKQHTLRPLYVEST